MPVPSKVLATILWYIGELSPLELYDFGGGNVVAPVPDINGQSGTSSYLTSHMLNLR